MSEGIVSWSMLTQVASIAGAVGALTYWGGRIARSSESVAGTVEHLAGELRTLAARQGEHGERIARLEGHERAGGRA